MHTPLRIVIAALMFVVPSGCAPRGENSFTRSVVGTPLAISPRFAGTAFTDLWTYSSVGTSTGERKFAVVHSTNGKSWSAVPVEALGSPLAGNVVGPVTQGLNSAYVAGSMLDGGSGLFLLDGSGVADDQSASLPRATAMLSSMEGGGGALVLAFTEQPGGSRLFKRTTGAFEEVTNIPDASNSRLTILAVRDVNDFYLWQEPYSTGRSPGVLHLSNGIATGLPWHSDRMPYIELTGADETWLWDRDFTGGKGLHGQGDTFTEWTPQAWPADTDPEKLRYQGIGIVALGPGRLAMICHVEDLAHSSDSTDFEKFSIRVLFLDSTGKVTRGPKLVQCASGEQCLVGPSHHLADKTLLLPFSDLTRWYTGSISSFE